MRAHTARRLASRAVILQAFLGRYATRLTLSLLILLSISPFAFVDRVWYVFFAVFGVEAAARTYVLAVGSRDASSPRRVLIEAALLVLDVLAWISFLPLAEATGLRFLRLARFVRLGLLLRYWGGTFRHLWHLLRREERARQIRMLAVATVGLVFISAALLHEMTREIDPNELGLSGPAGFADLVWWSVRQLADPGGLVSNAQHVGIVLVSLVMTLSGVVLFSFLIGIGTSAVADLMSASREQPMGYDDHSVLIGASEHITFLLDEVASYFDKHLRPPRWMVLGSEAAHRKIESEPRYRRIHYRRGSPYHAEDLAKVDAATAERFVMLGDPSRDEPDSDTMSALLSIREVNPWATVHAEVLEEKHATAVLAAGGDRTVVVATQHLLAVVMANLVARPEYERVVEELLTVRGSEIYAYLYKNPLEEGAPKDWPGQPSYGAFLAWAWEHHGCIPIGLASAGGGLPGARAREYGYVLDPAHNDQAKGASIHGIVGLSWSLDGVASMARDVASSSSQWRLEPSELPLPPCRLAERRGPAENILITRFVSRTPMLVEHLLKFLPGSTIWIMVASPANFARAEQELLETGESLVRFGDPERYDAGPRGTFERRPDGSFGYMGPDGQPVPGVVRLLAGDWSSRSDLLANRKEGFDLFDVDQIILQTNPTSRGDPDAKGVMALLKLTDLMRHAALGPRFKPQLEIVVEIVDPLKAHLLERRFAASATEERVPVSVVTTEWLRHVLMFQATVVPGFSELFYELFSHRKTALRRLVLERTPGARGREVDFGELLRHVYDQTRMTLIGVEKRTTPGSQPKLVLAPKPTDLEARIALDDVVTLFALGPAEALGAREGGE